MTGVASRAVDPAFSSAALTATTRSGTGGVASVPVLRQAPDNTLAETSAIGSTLATGLNHEPIRRNLQSEIQTRQ